MRPLKHLLCIFLFFFSQKYFNQVIETTKFLNYDRSKSQILTRFIPPSGFAWVKGEPGSFSEYLTKFPLHPPDFPVRYYNAVPIEKQNHHISVLRIDVGNLDLQQCADAWMRLYAEYLWKNKRFDEIKFELTSGQMFSWIDFKNGLRTQEAEERVNFISTGKVDGSYKNFRKYLNVIFTYAGTISLDRESLPISDNEIIRAGDLIIKPGSPGHTVIIVGVAKDSAGNKVYLLAESFMPAQDIHILVNHKNPAISPWYQLDVNSPQTVTAKYIFKPTSIKRFHALR
ncbi:hypothetical protein FNJ88_01935 [Chryseobacterium sp. SNU WT5]|nr:hypothetical protein FNJ88_01935 [Chryseobacterium sp. SNU WT5]